MDIKEVARRYEFIRQSGMFNMIMDATEVIKEIGCTKDQYFYVIKNYSTLIKEI